MTIYPCVHECMFTCMHAYIFIFTIFLFFILFLSNLTKRPYNKYVGILKENLYLSLFSLLIFQLWPHTYTVFFNWYILGSIKIIFSSVLWRGKTCCSHFQACCNPESTPYKISMSTWIHDVFFSVCLGYNT